HQPDDACRALLQYGKGLYLRTNTHFNLLTGHILEARGYDATYSFESREPENETPGNPITDLLISEEKIELLHGNVDIGGFGKGYLIDELARILQTEFALKYFLINGGGDMYATSEQEEPIEIYLEHPTKARHFIHRTTLLNQGFAASSPFKRIWQSHEQTYTHIVTNDTAPRVASFIKADSARDADAFATTALMLSEAELQQLAKTESFSVARFTPATNQLWHTKEFS
ncbi:FAD:protein FMN transferase, partial [Candidatus Kaiserbacteria bacterium]|nr:FAD:protein FMN transferase [Candidatus Kaiserbacteria bacterium]